MDKKTVVKSETKAIFWEYTAYYTTAITIENVLAYYVGNLSSILSLAVLVLQIYLINRAIDIKNLTFKTTFQFSILMSLVGGGVAGLVQAIGRYTFAKGSYDSVYQIIVDEYAKVDISQNVADQVFNILTNPATLFIGNIIAGAIVGAVIGLIMGSIAKSRMLEGEVA